MWSSLVVAELVELKQTGMSFEAAWKTAVDRHRPMLRDRGGRALRLFADTGGKDPFADLETVEAFTQRVCREAWHGEASVLKGLQHIRELLDDLDDSAAARRAPNKRGADRLVA